jgi:ZIP family zinc transporter
LLEAGLWGLAAASTLVIGAAAGLWLPIPRRIVALVMAFGAGALISALAFDLTEEAFSRGGTGVTAIGLAVGAVVFYLGDRAISSSSAGSGRSGASQASNGPAIVLGVLLDGLPESIVLGSSLIGGAGVTVSFLAAVAVSNLPEGLSGARDLSDEGRPARFIILLWIGVAVASGEAAALGFALLGGMADAWLAAVQAFAAGAILAMLADTMIPEAFESGGEGVALVTVLGFAVAFLLSAAS